MTAYDIVKKPVITEKTEILRRDYNKYTFLTSDVDEQHNLKVTHVL